MRETLTLCKWKIQRLSLNGETEILCIMLSGILYLRAKDLGSNTSRAWVLSTNSLLTICTKKILVNVLVFFF